MTLYNYNPLRDARSTRFVRLLPGSAGGIQCQLFRAILDDRNEYITLSYAWGSTRRNQAITCNGRTLQVTESLLSALRRLRLPDVPRVFWIDAICINQEDIEERNRQVSLMREIYQKAQQLFIWLGPGDSYSTAAVNVMRRFAEAQAELTTIGRLPYVYAKPEEWVSFAKLLQRAWFERLWIIQELAMGLQLSGDSRPVLLCGVHRFGLEVLKAACEWCNQLTFDSDHPLPEGSTMNDVQNGVRRFLVLCEMTKQANPEEARRGLWRYVKTPIPITSPKNPITRHWLLSKVAATRANKATDPRDRLFALYGFLRDGDDPVAVADYSKSTAAVYQEFARDYILQSKCLDVLSEVEEPTLRSFRNLPSWVPNWAIETSRIPLLRQTEMLGAQRPRKFARQACGALRPSIHSMRDDAILVDGIIFDEISWVSDALPPDQISHSKDSPSVLLDIWRQRASLCDPYPRRMPAIEAFYKTLICGREDKDQHLENFVAYWKTLHTSDDADMATFCINTPEIVQLLCHRPAGAEAVAQMHDACNALERLHIDASNERSQHTDAFFTALEMQSTLRNGDLSRIGGRQFFRNANPQRYSDLLRETAERRVFFTTRRGYMGLGVEGIASGDVVSILTGGKIPFVLRKSPPGEKRHAQKAPKSPYCTFKTQTLVASLIGEAYVHGIMNGEAVEKEWELQWDRISIV
jgi:Heterokaryon incompatibility protein (HET)